MVAKKYLFYVSQNYSYAILRPIQEQIWRRNGEVKWFLHGDINPDYLHDNEQRLMTIDDVVAYQADATLLPGNVVPSFIPGLKVAVFHGFNAGKLNRRGQVDHFQIRNCFDLYCTQGPNTTEPFKQLEAQHGHFKVIETGWSALDPLFTDAATSGIKEHSRPTILMCSTFSRNLTCAPHLYDTVKHLSQDSKWQWLIQFHPKMSQDIVDSYKGLENDNLSFIETDNVLPLLKQADVMVCDTSSVLLMFALQGKPVVTFNNIAPKDYMINISEPELLVGAIEQALNPSPTLRANIERFIADTHPYQDGQSSSRVLDAIDDMLAGKYPLAAKPKNWLRQIKMRRKLGYWKFFRS
ncbi:CDP-glycerol glycerophosphotransferase family protein [Thalassotalea ponticola]|uniref:CDP-glycerol glycerophosphotransferase family protein n=1 Tax=Thalassotalea ponticola TaxID=1523392 RepID=UPI0025B5C9D1|nr:CDP-glycerol glycerophosphotransferase family protein [Thalassotalea ponticola]MDN3651955.1 CDP-glycerol glycerophosphotransferase family protein [Thalassotalea ponticola]